MIRKINFCLIESTLFREAQLIAHNSSLNTAGLLAGPPSSFRLVIPGGGILQQKIKPFRFFCFSAHPFENQFSADSQKSKNPAVAGFDFLLRRGGDSNPRYGCPYASLANWWIKPLSHLSGMLNKALFRSRAKVRKGMIFSKKHL